MQALKYAAGESVAMEPDMDFPARRPGCYESMTAAEMARRFRRLSTRMVFLRDRAVEERSAWLREIYGECDQFRYFEHATAVFSSVHGNYDVFLAHGDDPVRLARLLRRNRPILMPKIKIALMSHSTPTDRAQLLNGGYDLVADCRMLRPEYVARVVAIHARSMLHAPRILGPLEDLRIVLRKYVVESVDMARMGNTELLLLARLAARKGRSVHSIELQKSAEGQARARSRKSLCVSISRLRRKLRPEYTIVSDYMNGYVFKDVVPLQPAA